jgi:hypothetical protein
VVYDDALYVPEIGEEKVCRVHISSILTNDWEQIKIVNFRTSTAMVIVKKRARGKAVY